MMTKSSGKKRQASAYHEAGHAVAAWVLGRDFPHASIRKEEGAAARLPDRTWRKSSGPNFTNDDREQKQIEADIIAAFAGGEAEHILTGKRNNVGSAHDHAHAASLAAQILTDREYELPAFMR